MKKRKIFKKISLAGLAACMFCLPILAGCAPTEMLPEKPTQGQNFDLGLNPETDPVVYTTASGLQIKKSDAKYSSTTTLTSNKGVSTTQNLTSFYYFTMGKFSGTIYTGAEGSTTANYKVTNEPVNWLIIGRGLGFNFESGTPAGSAIQGDVEKQEIAFSNSMYECMDLSSIPENSDIPEGCFLVLSEKMLGQSYFNSTGTFGDTSTTSIYSGDGGMHQIYATGWYGNRYRYKGDATGGNTYTQTWNNKTAGSLYTYINNLFSKNTSGAILKNNLGFSNEEASLIVPQQLYTVYGNSNTTWYQETPSTDGGTYYTMFPLACRSINVSIYQNFCIEDYLTINSVRLTSFINSNQSHSYYLRSGSMRNDTGTCVVYHGGMNGSGTSVRASSGVRPAMVMKLS